MGKGFFAFSHDLVHLLGARLEEHCMEDVQLLQAGHPCHEPHRRHLRMGERLMHLRVGWCLLQCITAPGWVPFLHHCFMQIQGQCVNVAGCISL